MKSRPSHAGAVIVAAFGFLAVFFTGQFPPFADPNELSRLETVYAFVEHGTFAIDRAIPVLGDHEDKAVSSGHFYSNKAPGLALAAIPVYRLLRVLFPPPHSAAAAIFVWLRILTVSCVCTIALARFHSRLSAGWGVPAGLVASAVAFGTPYLYYARSFLSHAWTAALVFLSWDLLRLARDREARRRGGSPAVAAGLLAGWAAVSEYPVALLGVLLAMQAAQGRSFRRLSLFALGACLPLALLLAYDGVCFGSPFTLSASREALPEYAMLSGRGLFGFTWPSPSVAFAYLFHPARGALLFSPFLLWVAAGFFRWWRRREERPVALFALTATVIFFVALCGYPNWHGGWALGNRYLLPVLFVAALAVPYALASPLSRALFAAAVSFSIAVHTLASATWPHFPVNVPWPPANGSAWFLARGWVAPGMLAEPARLALAFGVPLGAMVAGFGALRRWVIPLAAGVALFAATLVWSPELSYGGRLWRAAVYGRFSGRDPERIELQLVMRQASTPSEKRRAADAWRLFGK